MKHPLRSFAHWLGASKANLLIAVAVAVVMIASLSIFAAGNLIVPKSCQNRLGAKQAQELGAGMQQMGWKSASTYTCNVNWSTYHYSAIHGGELAAPQFRQVLDNGGVNPQKFRNFINSSSAVAGLFRDAARSHLNDASYNAWKTGQHFVAVQLTEPSALTGASYLDGSVFAINEHHRVPLPQNQIIILFLDPTTGHVNPNGNIVPDCGNVRISQIFPRQAQHIGKLRIVKFNDLNGNGKRNPGEPVMAGVPFRIPDIGVFKTNQNGEVLLDNLDPDQYEVIEQRNAPQLKDFQPTTKSDVKVSVQSGQTTVVTFGNHKPKPKPKPSPTPAIVTVASPTAPGSTPAPSPTPAVTPTPTASPTPTVTPTPSPSVSPLPSPTSTPQSPVTTITRVLGTLPKTGAGTTALIVSFLVVAGGYLGVRYWRSRRAK